MFRGLMDQPALRKALPMLIGVGSLALAGVAYMALSTGPERILYASLSDGERASVTQALETGGIRYSIDPGTGALSVAEEEL